MVSIFEGFLLVFVFLLILTVVALLMKVDQLEQVPQNIRKRSDVQMTRQEQQENARALKEAELHAEQLRHVGRPDGPLAKAQENLTALTETKTQLQSTEQFLQEARSRIIVLEHERASGTPQQSAGSSNATSHPAQAARIQDLENQLASSRTEFDRLFQEYQTRIVAKRVKSNVWRPRDDGEMKQEFFRLSGRTREWSRRFNPGDDSLKPTLSSHLTNVDYQTLLKSLKDVVHFETETLPPYLEQGYGQKLPLQALLAHDIYTKVFQNPFSCLGSAGQQFFELYQKLLTCRYLSQPLVVLG